MPPYRVIQWATGNIGNRALREVIRHPDLELVGLLTYDPAKDGVDAGVLCGEGPVGVPATTDRAAIHALAADCVLYMPHVNVVDQVCRLLESGINIVSTRMEYQNPAGLDPAFADWTAALARAIAGPQAGRERFEMACRSSRTSPSVRRARRGDQPRLVARNARAGRRTPSGRGGVHRQA